jgi:hypothetical protein
MNTRKKLTLGLAGVVLAGSLAFGAVASAAGTGGSTTTANAVVDGQALPHLTAQQKCDNKDRIETKAHDALDRIAARVTTLQQKRSDAVAAGDTAKVARIDRRLTRLATLSSRITTRLANFETWVTTNCPAT